MVLLFAPRALSFSVSFKTMGGGLCTIVILRCIAAVLIPRPQGAYVHIRGIYIYIRGDGKSRAVSRHNILALLHVEG